MGRRVFLVLLLLAFHARPLQAAVEGTPHDMTLQTGDIFAGACQYCHLPHRASGEKLWFTAPRGPETGWGSRPIALLCYTCHDNSSGGFNAEDMAANAYSELSHGYEVASIPLQPDGLSPVLPPLPGVETGLLDCVTCHDPHSQVPPFLREGTIDGLCKGCHGRENKGALGEDNVHGEEEVRYSLHPTDVDYADLPQNAHTSLHPFPPLLEQPTISGAWRLGGHRVGWLQGTGAISCQTCHPIHGGWNYTLGLIPGPPASSLTAIENEGDVSALCQACHQGGVEGETVGLLSDHPINTNDGLPETTYPEGWPAGAQGEVTCSSCHDVHGGMPGTSLMRAGGNVEDGWCFSCHSVPSLTPPYHHSSREIDDTEVFVSLLTCGDCHGQGEEWTAHNGFEGFKVEVLADSSDLCELCHLPENPLDLGSGAYENITGLSIDFTGYQFPSSHGRSGGTDSHLVNDFDDDSIQNCQVKTTVWEKSGGFSKYGPGGEMLCESCHGVLANVGLLLGDDVEARLTGGWRANLLLEAYEENDPGVGVEKPDIFPGPTLSALCRGCHYSVQEGVDPTFVHNPEIHTVIGYAFPEGLTPYGRETLEMITRPFDSRSSDCPEVSTADQMSPPSGLGVPFVPGVYSYPMENMVDCDSCHRPHGADTDSADDGVHRLLEYTEPGRHGTVPCLECHDTGSQCGFDETDSR